MSYNISGPLLYPSNIYNAQEIEIMSVDVCISNSISDTVSTLNAGILSNLIEPITSSNAGTKNYLINSAATPMSPTSSIQFNVSGQFRGSPLFYVSEISPSTVPNVLRIPNLTNGTVSFTGGTITGLSDPVSAQQLASKNYVDTLSNLTTSKLIMNSKVSYSANQMVSNILYRDTILDNLNNTIFDTTAPASDIISLMSENGSATGSSCSFYLKNVSRISFIYLKAGSGVLFNNLSSDYFVTVPPNYILTSKLIIQGLNILFYIESIQLSSSYADSKELISNLSILDSYKYRSLLTNSLKITNALFMNYYDDSTLNISQPISWENLLNGQVCRYNLTNDIINSFPEPALLFFPVFSGSDSFNGGYRFIFRNGDPTYSITLIESSGWIFDQTSNFTIEPKKSALLWFFLNSETKNITVFMIGKMDVVI